MSYQLYQVGSLYEHKSLIQWFIHLVLHDHILIQSKYFIAYLKHFIKEVSTKAIYTKAV